MSKKAVFVIVTLLFIAFFCMCCCLTVLLMRGGYVSINTTGTSSSQTKEDFTITLERGPCFGFCPVYSVTLDEEGNVTFDGERYILHCGEEDYKVSASNVAALKSAFDDIN